MSFAWGPVSVSRCVSLHKTSPAETTRNCDPWKRLGACKGEWIGLWRNPSSIGVPIDRFKHST